MARKKAVNTRQAGSRRRKAAAQAANSHPTESAPPSQHLPPAAVVPVSEPRRPIVAPEVPASLLRKLRPIDASGPGRASTVGPKSGVVVVGSLNMDLVVRTEVLPQPGETMLGQDLLQNPGGKGANQAAAAGMLWHRRTAGSKMVGRIGDDLFGKKVLTALEKARVDTGSVLSTRNTPTGAAVILVDRHGENAIVVAGGANRNLSATDLLAQRKTIEASVVLLSQLEIPSDAVACAIALAKRSGVLTILDPAPAPPEGLPESLYHVDILIPNQHEAGLLTGIPVRTPDDARRAAERFLLRGTRIVIVKMGSQGAVIVHRPETCGKVPVATGHGTLAPPAAPVPSVMLLVPGFRVPVVDTTAAGDAFAGALAVGLAEGMELPDAVRFANAAGALACTRPGAMTVMPSRSAVELLMHPPPPVRK